MFEDEDESLKMGISNLCVRGQISCSQQRNKFRKEPLAYDRADVAQLKRKKCCDKGDKVHFCNERVKKDSGCL
jgi:hypothetical protein